MFKHAKNVFRDIDAFGHPIRLNFNKKGNSHNTLLGACATLFSLAFLAVYFWIHFYRMWTYGGDTLTKYDKTVDLIDGDIVKL